MKILSLLFAYFSKNNNHYKSTLSNLHMNLVAFLGTDTENLGQITALVNKGEWDNVLLLKNKSTQDIQTSKPYKSLDIDASIPLLQLKDQMKQALKPHLSNEFEVALSLSSGTGKEHMALISALLSTPVGIKIAAFTKNGIEFIT